MLQQLDRVIFDFINRDCAHPVLDVFFSFWTDFQKTAAFYILVAGIIGFLIFKKNYKEIFYVALSSLGALLADGINSKVLKPFFARPRPTEVILRTAEQGSYSFPSSHAVDAFFIATILGLYFPKTRKFLFPLVSLTAISRVYCGVHYPGDILIGALTGIILAYSFYYFVRFFMQKLKFFSSFLLICFFSVPAFSVEDPTKGKPFFPWLWEDQFKPTLVKSVDKKGLAILAAGTGGVLITDQYDRKIDRFSKDGGNWLMDHDSATKFGKLGNGVAGLAIFGAQYVFDQENGLRTGRAIILTTISHMGIAGIVQRNRPDNRSDFLPYPSSFPSGHTSSAFAVAGSMAFAYGWKGGVPAYLAASAIAVSRLKERRHWASDIVGGAVLGTFWARAAFAADEPENKQAFFVLPVPIYDGVMLSALKEF